MTIDTIELIDENALLKDVMKDDSVIRTKYEDDRAQATFSRFLRLIGISPDDAHNFRVRNSDSLYISPNGRYIMALRYSKNYDRIFIEDPNKGHYWWTLDKLKDSFQSVSSGSCMQVFFVFCCHTHCSDHVDMELWQCCDEFLSIPVSVFSRHDIDLINFRPHFSRDEKGFEWRHNKKGIKENLNRYLSIHQELFREYR